MNNGKKYYQFGNPIKFAFRKHFCFFCGSSLEKRKHIKIVNSKSPEVKYYDFTIGEGHIPGDCKFIHKIFFCPKCMKEIEPVTQISYEDNEKWTIQACNKLLKYFKKEQIKKVWIDNDSNIFEFEIELENMQSIIFIITRDEEEIKIPCSIVGRKKYWERPYYIKKDKEFNKVFSDLIKIIK